MIKSMLLRTGRSELGHPDEVLAVHERILAVSPAQGRDIKVGSGRRVHVIEAGKGPPVVLLHGSSTSSLLLLPLLERLKGLRGIVVDRPGFGLSDPAGVSRVRFRDAAVEFLDEALDELELDTLALAGNSMGGTWALWYALARPDRVRQLVLLGAAPLLPGTRVPPPLRVMATSVVGELLERLTKPSPKLVVRMMTSMGEKDTIINYPDQIEALVAAGNDPVVSEVNLAELGRPSRPSGSDVRCGCSQTSCGNSPCRRCWYGEITTPSERSRSPRRPPNCSPTPSSRCCMRVMRPGSATPTEQPNSFPRLSVEFTGGEVPGSRSAGGESWLLKRRLSRGLRST